MGEESAKITLTVILLALIVPSVLPQTEFVTRIFDEFGSTVNSSQQLSNASLSRLINQVLNGKVFNKSASICEERSCSTQEICYSPLVTQTNISSSNFASVCPRILYALTQDCIKGQDEPDNHHDHKHSHEETKNKPTPLEVWGYGFLFVTIISLCSLGGIVVLPLMNKSYYSTILMFLISLGVGALVANGIICLIPEAFEIPHEQEDSKWRACMVVGGIYLFFVIERILKMITDRVGGNGSNRESNYKLDQQSDDGKVSTIELTVDESEIQKPVATVAWMIIFGDAFHNFIDGLSIGAAFSDSVLLGISICIAVFCEEFPHELGDFAILLNAGLSKKKALLFNFLSACTCYLGLIVGITISEVADATPWILGLAGGMFLYIALADMMPEMNRAAEEHKDKPFRVFFIQNAGFLCGFAVILLCEHFGHQIQLDPQADHHHHH